jgi:uncharacterized protein (TIRG00374 family)
LNDESHRPARKRISGNLKLGAGIVISALFLYFAARNVDFSRIPATLSRVDYPLYLLSILVYVFSFFVKALQVKIMLSFDRGARTMPLVPPVMIGYYCNNIFPLKAGEVVRSSLIARKLSLPFWAVLSAMLLERSMDLVFVLLVALLTSFFIAFPVEVIVSIRGLVIFLIFVYAFFITLAVAVKKGWAAPGLVTRLLPEKARSYVGTMVTRLADGLWAIKKPAPLLGTLTVGLAFWIINMLGYYLRLESFGLPCSFAAVGFFIVVVGLGVSIPSAPSYVGVFHLLVVFALGVFNVSKDEAFSFALFSHAVDFVVVGILGNISIVMEGINFRALRKSASAAPLQGAGRETNGTGGAGST